MGFAEKLGYRQCPHDIASIPGPKADSKQSMLQVVRLKALLLLRRHAWQALDVPHAPYYSILACGMFLALWGCYKVHQVFGVSGT